MFWRASQYDNRIVNIQNDEIGVRQLAEMYPELIYFEAELVVV